MHALAVSVGKSLFPTGSLHVK